MTLSVPISCGLTWLSGTRCQDIVLGLVVNPQPVPLRGRDEDSIVFHIEADSRGEGEAPLPQACNTRS
jgi:hypothetical protein